MDQEIINNQESNELEIVSVEQISNNNKKELLLSTTSLVFVFLPIIVYLLSMHYSNVYNQTNIVKYENLAVKLEDISIWLFIVFPILGLIFSTFSVIKSKGSLYSIIVLSINCLIIAALCIYLVYILFFTPWW